MRPGHHPAWPSCTHRPPKPAATPSLLRSPPPHPEDRSHHHAAGAARAKVTAPKIQPEDQPCTPKLGTLIQLMEGGVFPTASWMPRPHPWGLCLPPASPPLQLLCSLLHRGFYSGLHCPGAMNRAMFQESGCPLKPPWSCSYTLKDAFLRRPSVSLAWERPRALDTLPGPTGTRPHARPAQPGSRVPGTLSGVSTGTDGDELSPVTLTLGSHGGPLHAYAGSPS